MPKCELETAACSWTPRADGERRKRPWLRKASCVHAWLHGFGQVMRADDVPLIRFLDGRELRIPADQLSVVPTEVFESEVANRAAINAYLILRVHGRGALGPSGRLWTQDDEGLWATTDSLPPEPAPPPGVVPFFMPDDIGNTARVLSPDELPPDHEIVDCAITRVGGEGID